MKKNMKKNIYVKPSVKVTTMMCNHAMLSASSVPGVDNGSAGPDIEVLSGKDMWSGDVW